MTQQTVKPKLPHILIYAGAFPFMAGAFLLATGFTDLPLLGQIDEALAAYGLVIVIFLTGIHWGQQLSLGRLATGLFLASNFIAILIWLAWLILPTRYFIVFLAVPLIALLAIDRNLFCTGILERKYFQSRTIVTTTVILCLNIAAFYS